MTAGTWAPPCARDSSEPSRETTSSGYSHFGHPPSPQSKHRCTLHSLHIQLSAAQTVGIGQNLGHRICSQNLREPRDAVRSVQLFISKENTAFFTLSSLFVICRAIPQLLLLSIVAAPSLLCMHSCSPPPQHTLCFKTGQHRKATSNAHFSLFFCNFRERLKCF